MISVDELQLDNLPVLHQEIHEGEGAAFIKRVSSGHNSHRSNRSNRSQRSARSARSRRNQMSERKN